MQGFSRVSRLVAAIALAGVATTAAAQGSGPIAISDGRLDYANVDPATRTLFVARGATVTAIPLDGGAPHDFGTIRRGHAVVPLPGGVLAVTSGEDDTLRLFDQASGAQTAAIAVGRGPDAAIRDPRTGHVLVINTKGGTVSEVDPVARRVLRTITLEPGLEFAAVDKDGTLFVNNEAANVLHRVDLRSGAVLRAIPLTGCESPTGLGYDQQSDHLISACANGKAAVVDADDAKLVGLLDIGAGPDSEIIESARRRA
jgi:DNA-binding beta-propeller fold protein YncE